MSISDGSVPWNLLPGNPLGFFGLNEDYTRKDLKRAYNKYLKLFKPEKFPEEFKKIRNAYETLEESLAYGTKVPIPTVNIQAPSNDEVKVEWETLLQNNSSEHLTDFLQDGNEQAETLIPERFLFGAFTKEVSEGEKAFLDSILEGLKHFPYDFRLNRALEKFCKLDHKTLNSAEIIEILDQQKIENFCQMTEGLWIKVLEREGFQKFFILLQESEHIKSSKNPLELAVFFTRICKRMFFKLDVEFVKNKISEAEEYFDNLPEGIQIDIEFILALVEYNTIENKLSESKNFYKSQLHQLIVDWCEKEPPEATRSALSFLCESNHLEALNSFEINNEKYIPFWRIYNHIIAELEFETDLKNHYFDWGEKQLKVRTFLLEVEKKTGQSWIGSCLNFANFLRMCYHIFICLIPSFIISSFDLFSKFEDWKFFLYCGIIVASAIGYYLLLMKFPFLFLSCMTDFIKNKTYLKVWREEIVDFIKETGIPYNELGTICANLENDNDISFENDIQECIEVDLGIKIFSLGNQFQ